MREKISQSEIDGVQYRKAKGWQVALGQLNGTVSVAFASLIGMISYLANVGIWGCSGSGWYYFDCVQDI